MALNIFISRLFLVPCRSVSTLIGTASLVFTHTTTISINRRPFSTTNFIHKRTLYTSFRRNRDHDPFPALHHPAPNLRLDSEHEAEELLYYLRKSERELLYKVLRQHHKKGGLDVGPTIEIDNGQGQLDFADDTDKSISREQMKLLFLCNSLPFIGFGILDNLIMILAGEYIDSTLGIYLGLSTMAAAGFGNIISDIAGVGFAHYIELGVAKFFNVRPPPLNSEQWDSSKARWTSNSARAFGLTFGCLIGMFPLLFYDETQTQEKKLKLKHHQHSDEGEQQSQTAAAN